MPSQRRRPSQQRSHPRGPPAFTTQHSAIKDPSGAARTATLATAFATRTADPRAAAGVTSSTRCDRNRGDGFGVAGGVRSGRGPLAALVLVVLLAAGCAPAGAVGLSLAACGTPASNSPGAT